MTSHIDLLSKTLGLSPYQANKLRIHSQQYNISRLEKRGGVLYAPYLSNNIWEWIKKVTKGPRADLIGHDRMLLHSQRNIKFCANGYHCVRLGKYTYYANASGHVISQHEFMRATKN